MEEAVITSGGYVECSECGHVLEDHDESGCSLQEQGCTCRAAWPAAEVQAYRAELGLPARWR